MKPLRKPRWGWNSPTVFELYVLWFCVFRLLADQSQIQSTSSASQARLHISRLKFVQGPLSNPAHIKSMSSNLAESCYLLRWSIPMADPEHPLTHLLHRELRTWGPAWSDGKTGPERWSESPPGTLVSFRPFPASLPSLLLCLPFHLQSIAGSKLLASGNTMNGAGGYRRSGNGYGKRQDKHHKERGFSFQFKPPPSSLMWK